jgi:hypothetical protein
LKNKKNIADQVGVKNSVIQSESENWICRNCFTIEVLKELVSFSGLNEMITKAKKDDNDDLWLLHLLGLRQNVEDLLEDLGNH